jgi:hypothetical protein
MPAPYSVPAKGSGEIKTFLVPNPFQEDTWVKSIEIRPGSPSVVHHAMLQVPEDTPGPAFSWGGVSGAACIPATGSASFMESPVGVGQPNQRGKTAVKPPKNFAILEAVYVPGSPVTDFQFDNSAKLIRGGGNLRIEVHYTPNGKAVSDQTDRVRPRKETPRSRFVTLAPKSIANVRSGFSGSRELGNAWELEFGRMLSWYG